MQHHKFFHFNNQNKAANLSLAIGVIVIGYSLFTRYGLSFFKGIPIKAHLLLDALVGAFLIVSPWLFGFSDEVYLPQVAFGLFAIVASRIAKTHSDVPKAAAMT